MIILITTNIVSYREVVLSWSSVAFLNYIKFNWLLLIDQNLSTSLSPCCDDNDKTVKRTKMKIEICEDEG